MSNVNSQLVSLAQRIEQLIQKHGSLLAVQEATGVDVMYMERIQNGEKPRPHKDCVDRLGLKTVIMYRVDE